MFGSFSIATTQQMVEVEPAAIHERAVFAVDRNEVRERLELIVQTLVLLNILEALLQIGCHEFDLSVGGFELLTSRQVLAEHVDVNHIV